MSALSLRIREARWRNAQAAEAGYWASLSLEELLRLCREKVLFYDLLGSPAAGHLFDGKEVLEIGVGPLGISLAAFYGGKAGIKRLVKVDPLPWTPLAASPLAQASWLGPFLAWMEALAEEGEYVEVAAEHMPYGEEFDTVITYNVLDHVGDPRVVLKNAYRALRPGGLMLTVVDCRSVTGQLRFQQVTRRISRGSLLVEAHPHSFLPATVEGMLRAAGFEDVWAIGMPRGVRRIAGRSFRPAFIARKPQRPIGARTG